MYAGPKSKTENFRWLKLQNTSWFPNIMLFMNHLISWCLLEWHFFDFSTEAPMGSICCQHMMGRPRFFSSLHISVFSVKLNTLLIRRLHWLLKSCQHVMIEENLRQADRDSVPNVDYHLHQFPSAFKAWETYFISRWGDRKSL